MQFARRRPEYAYLDSHLWVPKELKRESQLELVYSYPVLRTGEILHAYEEQEHHWLLPRNAMTRPAVQRLGVPVRDVAFRDFPRVDLKSATILDFQDPTKDYQQKGCDALLKVQDGILSLRCGAGKTRVGLHAASFLRVPILVLVNDKGLAGQWIANIKEIYGLRDDEIGRCFGGKFSWRHPITVATVQTIAARVRNGSFPMEMIHHMGLVLADEAHVMGAPYFSKAIPPFHGRRWGLSATPNREDEFDSLLTYNLGAVVYSYLIPDQMPLVYFRRIPTSLDFGNPAVVEAVTNKSGEIHHGKLWGYLSTLEERTSLIVKEVQKTVDAGRQVIVLTHSREMCERLDGRFPNGGVTHGGVKEAEHLRVIAECNPVIAIMQRGKQALDKPDLDTLFILEPTTKENVLQQAFGRILRILRGLNKKPPVVVIYEDARVRAAREMCEGMRSTLRKWPAEKGGRIKYKYIGKKTGM